MNFQGPEKNQFFGSCFILGGTKIDFFEGEIEYMLKVVRIYRCTKN
jgi:hypothetical protein